MKPETLTILTPGFPKDEADSTCLPFLQQWIIELNRQFPLLQIIILALDYPFVNEPYLWKTNQVIPFNGWKKTRLSKLLKWRSVGITLKKIAMNQRPIGLLSIWCGESAFLANTFAGKNRIPHFCWIVGQDARADNKYVRRINPPASALIAISAFIQQEFEKNYRLKPQHIIPVGIDHLQNQNVQSKREIDILGAGSLISLKQYPILIEIVHDILAEFPGIKVQLCGKGPAKENLEKRIDEHGLGNNIQLNGEINHTDILHLMQRAKIFLHPSLYEGMSAVCLEALAAGCHVISFTQPMAADIPQWHIVSSKEAMTEKTRYLLSDPDLPHESVVPFRVTESVEKIMDLFHYNKVAIS